MRWILLMMWTALPLAAQANPNTSAADVAEGKRIFGQRCAGCHGQAGEGGRGPALNGGVFRRGGTDREVFVTIRDGVPNTEMLGSNQADADIWRLVAFVKQLGQAGGTSAGFEGDIRAGQAVFASKGCSGCHMVDGQGSDLGPDLSRVGSRAANYLRESVVNPNADVGFNYLVANVTTAAGEKIRGIFVNEDDYSIQLRDVRGNPRSFLKRDLKDFQHERDSLMPSYASLSAADLTNLIAYLSSLKGGR